jgi:putative PIN family toxin of toxin-antitoxin system
MCLLLSHAWHETRFALIASENIIEEVQKLLSAPKMKDTFHLTEALITSFVETLRKDAILVPSKADAWGAIPEDPSDKMFLTAALDGRADVIVSGDKHLLNLDKFKTSLSSSPVNSLIVRNRKHTSNRR